MDQLRCVVERTTYQSSETGFAVLQCRVKGYPELVPVVGNMPEVYPGTVLNLEGFWKMDARYGRQFSVTRFEETLPATVLGITNTDPAPWPLRGVRRLPNMTQGRNRNRLIRIYSVALSF